MEAALGGLGVQDMGGRGVKAIVAGCLKPVQTLFC